MSERRRAAEYRLPKLQAVFLVQLVQEFYAQPGVEEEYRQWLREKKKAKKQENNQEKKQEKKRKENNDGNRNTDL